MKAELRSLYNKYWVGCGFEEDDWGGWGGQSNE